MKPHDQVPAASPAPIPALRPGTRCQPCPRRLRTSGARARARKRCAPPRFPLEFRWSFASPTRRAPPTLRRRLRGLPAASSRALPGGSRRLLARFRTIPAGCHRDLGRDLSLARASVSCEMRVPRLEHRVAAERSGARTRPPGVACLSSMSLGRRDRQPCPVLPKPRH